MSTFVHSLLVGLWLSLSISNPPLRVLEADGTPNYIPVYEIELSGMTLTQISPTRVRIMADSGGGGAGAVYAATGNQYVVMALAADLTADRRLQVTSGLLLVDGGADGDVTLRVAQYNSMNALLNFPVQQAKLYSNTSSARIDAGTPVWRLLYSATTTQYGMWQFVWPHDYGTNPRARLVYSATSAQNASRTMIWGVNFWAVTPSLGGTTGGDQVNIASESYAATNEVTVTELAGISAGWLLTTTINLTNLDSVSSGDLVMMRVHEGTGTIVGDRALYGVTLEYIKN